ncbi:MAG: DUF1972 domain-containing protein [Hydrotalea sp. AMD]|uniref:DUF1972 domain-containing protein n=1 Tax=Hydrotalea sp. AMD TaxID=2501297 RepID=UPI000943E3DA|nr:DUF1972 domain-containing protein [Hydrotalea sp. AMD]RWZ88334.1 MAG: DUF1972 domain-containing protein [Hydrotalea sp. AMD]
MKLAVIGSRGYPYVYSGYETFVSEVTPKLCEMGIDVHVYCHRALFKEKPKQVNGVKLHYIYCIQSKSLSQLSNSFLSTLHALFLNYDVILYVNSANGVFGILTKLFHKKTVINVDGLEWLRPKWKGLGAKVFYFTSRMATKWMDVIITDAEEMRKIYLTEFNRDSKVIAYGANIRYSSNTNLIEKWKLRKENYYLIVGRLIPDNNGLLILEEFISSHSQKQLVVVGDVPYDDEYARKIKLIKDSRIIFTGYVTDANTLAELYHNSFAYIHGHEFGGTNPTLLKALAYGCTVLALDTVFSREVLVDENYGLYFTKGKGSLLHLIENIEKDLNKVHLLRERARERILQNYSWNKIVNQYYNLLHEIKSNIK